MRTDVGAGPLTVRQLGSKLLTHLRTSLALSVRSEPVALQPLMGWLQTAAFDSTHQQAAALRVRTTLGLTQTCVIFAADSEAHEAALRHAQCWPQLSKKKVKSHSKLPKIKKPLPYLKVKVAHDYYEYAHRLVLWAYNGPPPAGTEAVHLCNCKSCLNPAHLVWVSIMGQMQRAGHGDPCMM